VLLNETNVMLADSSFYLCFLEDIEKPEVLKKLLDGFTFLITPIVYNEVSKSRNFKHIKANPKIILLPKENLGEALRPFFSKKEIEKGETEVIELAYQFYVDNNPKMFILDERGPRLFVYRNLPYLAKLMIGTVGFVGKCYYKYAILEKNEASTIVVVISKSKFRVSAEVISEVLSKIQNG
jgi:predicted nucleic acid-binding protein